MTISDILGILGFFISLTLAINKLFFEGKPKLKIKYSFTEKFPSDYIKYTSSFREKSKFLVISMTNIGTGNIIINTCGFLQKNKDRLVLLNEAFLSNPLDIKLPYKLEERNRFDLFYLLETFYEIPEKQRTQITHIYAQSKDDKEWKINVSEVMKLLNSKSR